MVRVKSEPHFRRIFSRIKDSLIKKKIHQQTKKIISNPRLGKPMSYSRKGTREVYIHPYRLSYRYIEEEDTVVFLDFYHKNKQ